MVKKVELVFNSVYLNIHNNIKTSLKFYKVHINSLKSLYIIQFKSYYGLTMYPAHLLKNGNGNDISFFQLYKNINIK